MQGEHDSHHNKVHSLSPSVNTANQYIRVVESVICRLTVTLESATIASTAERPWRTRWRRFHALARVATHPYSTTTDGSRYRWEYSCLARNRIWWAPEFRFVSQALIFCEYRWRNCLRRHWVTKHTKRNWKRESILLLTFCLALYGLEDV